MFYNKTNEVVYIYSRFYTLETEKRERIINAAINEFARSGFEKASTNEIIKEANISKGSLFNYFNSKKELYLYLFEYMAGIIEKIYEQINLEQRDIFERFKEIGIIKLKVIKKYPQAFNFLKTATKEDAAEVKQEINKIGKDFIRNGYERIYKNIDLTKFRSDIDVQKTINIINWATQSFAEQQVNELNSYGDANEAQLREWDEYFDIMKRCFYKQEEK